MTSERIDAILQSVSHTVDVLVPAERFYVILFDQNKNQLSFPLVRQNGSIVPSEVAPWSPRSIRTDDCLPDCVISGGDTLLIEKGLSAYLQSKKLGYWPDGPVPHAWLGVPLTIAGQAVGALILETWQESRTFDNNQRQVLSTIARQTVSAIENAQMKEQLERKVKHLRTLNYVGQQLTTGLIKQESEILELIYRSAGELDLDTYNMSIVFYDPDPTDSLDVIRGRLRFAMAMHDGKAISIPSRRVENGLLESVIRTKATLNAADLNHTYQEFVEDNSTRVPRSWLGVPMIAEGQVFGVIALHNHNFERLYSVDDQEILEILASQAAIALLNMRYYEAWRKESEQRVSVEKTAIMSTMATEFAHKMNNIAGTIPVRVNMAMAELDPENPKDGVVIKQLDRIKKEAGNLLDAAKIIRESLEIGKSRAPENVNINDVLRMAIQQSRNMQNTARDSVYVEMEFDEQLPLIQLERDRLLDTLTSIIKNGFEAIHEGGKITITTRKGYIEDRPAIEILIADTGVGIPPSELPKIFDLFYSTKGEKGLGFGLWRDKVFIRNLGGEIDVTSEVNYGSTFRLKLPIDQTIPDVYGK